MDYRKKRNKIFKQIQDPVTLLPYTDNDIYKSQINTTLSHT